jgi:hypothetical protein
MVVREAGEDGYTNEGCTKKTTQIMILTDNDKLIS